MSEVEDLRLENEQLRLLVRELRAKSDPAISLAELAQSELSRSERLARQVFNAAVDAMILVDETGRFVDVNAAACTLYGMSRSRLLRTGVLEFADDQRAWQDLLLAGQRRGEQVVTRPDGSVRHVDYAITARAAEDLHLIVFRDVTVTRQVDWALRQSEERLRTVVSNAPIVLFALDARGVFTFCEGRALERGGISAQSLLGRSVFVEPLFSSQAHSFVRRVLSGNPAQWRGSAGNLVFETSVVPIYGDDGQLTGAIGVSLDVTERDHAESALRDNEAKFRAMIEESAEGICLVREDGRFAYASQRAVEILGVDMGALAEQRGFDWVHPDDFDRVTERLGKVVSAVGGSAAFECRVAGTGSSPRWVEVHTTNLLADRAVQAIIVNIRDISARKHADDALRASEYRYRRIIETTSDGVWMLDAEACTTFASTRLATMLGYSATAMNRRSLISFVADDQRGTVRAARAAWLRGIAARYELRLIRSDGSLMSASLQTNPLFDAGGGFEGALAMVTDVTELRRADAERARLAAIVESSGDAIYSIDLDCQVVAWNRGAENLYGYSAAEILGQSMMVLVPGEQLNQLHEVRDKLLQAQNLRHIDTVRLRKDGTSVEVALSVSPICNPEGEVVGCSVIARDLSERRKVEAALRRSEDELRQAQKIEAVGRLAGGVAHDFNNLLSVILSYAELTLESLGANDPVRDDVNEICKAGKRAVALTQQLLAFSRQQVLQPRVVDLNEIVTGMDKMLRRLLGEHIELSVLCDPALHPVTADPGQIEQILMNLVINARDAMSLGGQLVLSTANIHIDEAHASAQLRCRPGEYARISVQDTGEGMDEATRARIFDPFFTTKEKGKGTGLGLSTVFGIVQQSGGAIVVDSQPGRGTRFDVYLPGAEGVPTVLRAESVPPPSVAPATETILLAEDEEQVRVLARTILRRHGYQVLEASNAGAALLLSEQYAGTIHLLLTDVVMPLMSGRQLAHRLSSGRPHLRVLYMSGYTDDAVLHNGIRHAEVAFLQKPFTPTLLTEKVRMVLDGRATRGAG